MAKISISAVIRQHKDGTQPPDKNMIFVFGSNTQGFHGGGAARAAMDHYGAEWGKGFGLVGKSYAIPTIEVNAEEGSEVDRRTMTVKEIKAYVDKFNNYAKAHPDQEFFLTRLGCVIAGHTDKDIAPLFKPALPNCDYPDLWVPFLK